jgi:hypothetical protein
LSYKKFQQRILRSGADPSGGGGAAGFANLNAQIGQPNQQNKVHHGVGRAGTIGPSTGAAIAAQHHQFLLQQHQKEQQAAAFSAPNTPNQQQQQTSQNLMMPSSAGGTFWRGKI